MDSSRGLLLLIGVLIVGVVLLFGYYVYTEDSMKIRDEEGALGSLSPGAVPEELDVEEDKEPSVEGIPVSACGVLDQVGETYVLIDDLMQEKTEPCVTIAADDIVLDCAEFSIINMQKFKSALLITGNSPTVQSCHLIGGKESYGIKMERVRDGTIIGNSITGFKYGIWMYDRSSENMITRNTFVENVDGIYIQNSEENSVDDNVFSRQMRYGIHNFHSEGGIFTENIACDNVLADFYCTESLGVDGRGNQFNRIEDCKNFWPQVNADYVKCEA